MRSSERRCKLSKYFWVFLKNVPLHIKIIRKIFTRVDSFMHYASCVIQESVLRPLIIEESWLWFREKLSEMLTVQIYRVPSRSLATSRRRRPMAESGRVTSSARSSHPCDPSDSHSIPLTYVVVTLASRTAYYRAQRDNNRVPLFASSRLR